MDSVVSSLALAYYFTRRGHGKPCLPVVNCRRDFFPMKLDINMHLAEHGLPDLIFLDDLMQPEVLERVVEVALVDHNRLDASQEDFFGP